MKNLLSQELQATKQLIENLTDDEDFRQELWVHFLSGHGHPSFLAKLENIHLQNIIFLEYQRVIAYSVRFPLSGELEESLRKFAPVESSILILVALGFSIDQIAKYKDICPIRLNQLVFSIRGSNLWEKIKRERPICSRRGSTRMSGSV